VQGTNDLAKAAKIGYPAISLVGHGRELKVLASRSCPYRYAWFLDPSKFTLHGLGEVPEIFKDPDDGKSLLRLDNADAFELRMGWNCNLYTPEPRKTMCVYLPA